MSARNMIRPTRTLSCVALLVGTALAGSTAAAQAVLDPATQPADTLAPYVLRDTNLEPSLANPDGGTRAYRPWFENGAWSGDLIEYEVTEDGVRVVRNDTGKYPRDGATWRGTQALWSARYKFPDYEAYDVALEIDPLWECTDEDPEYWKNRNLFTVANGAKAAFLWNSLTDAQRLALDSATAADDLLDSQQFGSPILNFIRGDRSNERCKSGDARNFRWRFSILGDIINSRPVYAPAGDDGVVVVGANDGMLHGFNATTGVEQFGYVPSMLMGTLNKLRVSPYRHTYFVDGELRHRDIGTRATPKHVVAGGLGAGGKGIFALDVTDPDSPEVLFELAGTSDAFVGGDSDTKIGHIYGRPNIAQLPNGDWYVVTGNGYGTGNAHLVLIRLTSNGTPLADPTYTYVTVDTSGANGLSAPALVDATRDGRVDYAYAGDLKGNLWRIDFTKSNTVTKLFAAGATKPITVEPDITRHPTGAGLMVYFGTGSLLSRADAANVGTQSVYGIWDRGDEATVAASSLVQQELVERTGTWTIPKEGSYCTVLPAEDTTESTGRYVIDQQTPNWGTDLGWQVDLPRLGERLIGHPQVRANRLQFTTTTPPDMGGSSSGADAGAGSWIVQLDLASGGNLPTPRSLFDVNRSCALDAGDHLEIDVGGTPQKFFAVGLNLGPFNIAQPTFGRVKFDSVLEAGVDGVYINALQLPPEQQPQQAVQGQLDVTTDSPLGPTWAPVPEPAKQPFESRQFPQASGPTKPFVTSDGLGHRVDGHSFGYNKVHGVDYVDLIDLEPRRGKYRLDVGAVYNDGGTYRPITFLADGVTPRVAEQELNRVGEVGIAGTQKFIVMLTNADLSRENEIQIGCRKWPVYEYQTLMMKHLRSANAMSGLAADKLIFTLNELADPALQGCAEPTLRITPTDRIGKLDATLATLPGCVNNTDLYNGSPPDIHLTRKSELNADGTFTTGKGPVDLYKTEPHVTRNKEGSGYRWRNGALTVQLLAVKADGTADFTLQDSTQLPRGTGIEGEDLGWGGAYAKGFAIVTQGSGKNAVNVVVPVNQTPGTVSSRITNGMLYELSLFWHWGDMTRFQQQGGGRPVSASCYGTSANVAPSLAFETEWFTPGDYKQLTGEFTSQQQQEYLALLAQLLSPNEAEVAAAIKALGDLFKDKNIADYHRLRHYVDNSKQLNENHLIDIDRNSPSNDVTVDGTPAQVIDIERDLLPALGPNFKPGRRSWMDITPEAAP